MRVWTRPAPCRARRSAQGALTESSMTRDPPPRGTPRHEVPEPPDDEEKTRRTPAPSGSGRGGAAGAKESTASLYQLLVESVQDYAIFALDPAGRVMTWSAGAARLNGYARTEIIGRHFSVFYS